MLMAATDWSALEIAKLVVSALTPIIVLGLGVVLTNTVERTARRVEDVQWANRKVIERRLELYNEMAPRLNDLYAFFMRFGQFDEITPEKALTLKRELDRTFYANEPLFSPDFGRHYKVFIKEKCFREFIGPSESAKIRTSPVAQAEERRRRGGWRKKWEDMFAAEGLRSTDAEIKAAYDALMEAFARELNAMDAVPILRDADR
jgi:hypothetical protein